MSIIERNLVVSGNLSSQRVKAMFDSGSSFSFIKRNVVEKIGYLKVMKNNIEVSIANGKKMRFTDIVVLQIMMNKNKYFQEFVVANIPEQMIIGVDFMQKYGHTLVFTNDTVKSKKMNLKTSRGVYRL